MKQRLLFIARFYALTILIFTVAKAAFMLANSDSHPFSPADMAAVIGHGLSLDLSTGLYLLALPFLAVWASVWVRVPRAALSAYLWAIAALMALAFVADTSLYRFWQFKLDASCLQYLDSPTGINASVSAGYLVTRAVWLAAATAAIRYAYHLGLAAGTAKACRPMTRRAKVGASALMLLLTPALVIGIRGGLGESTTNIGQVYFSPRQFLNHAAVNPLFSFIYSLGKSGDYVVHYSYYSQAECDRLTEGCFDTRSDRPDTLLNTRRPNIVIVVMESCGGQFTELGGHREITPNLNRLCREGVYFTQCYANSWRTDRGCVSILSGWPAYPTMSVMKMPEKSRKLPSIARTLKRAGYDNTFLYGGDINFTNMRSYVLGTGYDHLAWKADYSAAEQASANWGVRDDIMFASLLSDIKGSGKGPWMKTLLTLSSHEPWDVPDKVLGDEVYNAFHYLDRCLGRFVADLRRSPAWDNLLLVILPDHGCRYRDVNETTRLFSHIPMLWLGGAVKRPCRIDRVCNQSDLAATLFGQMGIGHGDFTFSRDVAARNYRRPMAFHTFNNGITVIDSCAFTVYDLDARRVIASEGGRRDEQVKLGKALLQLTSEGL